MSEARASLLSGEVVELSNVSAIDSTSARLTWDVSIHFFVNVLFIYVKKKAVL